MDYMQRAMEQEALAGSYGGELIGRDGSDSSS
jgi:hypothetical protein